MQRNNPRNTQRKDLLKASAEKLKLAKAEIERLLRINQQDQEKINDLQQVVDGLADMYLTLKRKHA